MHQSKAIFKIFKKIFAAQIGPGYNKNNKQF
jgi:hypothetical protein